MRYKCLKCGEILTPGDYYCADCALNNDISNEDGSFKSPEEWPNWAREYYDAERELRKLNSEKILEIEQNLG